MTLLLACLATLACLLGAAILYLASPHQKMRAAALPTRPAWIAGGGALAVSLILFELVSGPASAVFVWFTLLMLAWSVPPLAIALRRHRQGKAR